MPSRTPSPPDPTLKDLIRAVDDCAASPQETMAVVAHLLRSGRVRFQRRHPTPPRRRPPCRSPFLQIGL